MKTMEIPNYQPFYLQSLDELRAEIARLGLDVSDALNLTIDEDISPLGNAAHLGGIRIPNRFCAQPIAGGDAQPDGSPSALTKRRYVAYAKGAFGLVWIERTRTHEGNLQAQLQKRLCLSPSNVSHFAAMLEEMRAVAAERPFVVLQLDSTDPAALVSAAKLARDAGFDGVDVQSERTTLPGIVARIRESVPDIHLCIRLCVYEAVRGGFGVSRRDFRKYDLSAPLELVRRLIDSGVQLLNVTSASPRLMGAARGNLPIADYEQGDEHPLMVIARQMTLVRCLRENFPGIHMVGSGLSWLRQFLPNFAAAALRAGWIDFAGLGRSALAYPDLPAHALRGGVVNAGSTCMVCFACSQLADAGKETGCVVRDAGVYGAAFREMRRLDADILLAGAARCHLCESAPCREKSPTRTDIASFIKAFREGRERDAYEVLRSGNPLPEMTAHTSPGWLEEEGACIEATLTGAPVPIMDLQYTVAWRARQSGLTGVRIPTACDEKRVAIVGAGPTGIAAAVQLLELGHRVHIYEASTVLGGVPMRLLSKHRSIPGPQEEIDALLQPAIAAGRLEISFGKSLGTDIFIPDLAAQHHSVLLAVGLWSERSLGAARGVIGALDLIERGVQLNPRRVAVLAGGDSAMDACRVLEACGAIEIYVVFDGPRSELHWHMPEGWFTRPGVHAMMNWKPLGYECDVEGNLSGLHLRHSKLGIEFTQPVDLVIEAMGLELPENIKTQLAQGRGLFHAAGAMLNGGASVGQCIAEGNAIAALIHRELLK
jgi:NADPH-dependent glutamate synthase beta subunit-like oxidoreductase/2,4-dienoyl-CoA reductase-like NADH-dependent reductase (Old Yellow Enzyme family)